MHQTELCLIKHCLYTAISFQPTVTVQEVSSQELPGEVISCAWCINKLLSVEQFLVKYGEPLALTAQVM